MFIIFGTFEREKSTNNKFEVLKIIECIKVKQDHKI